MGLGPDKSTDKHVQTGGWQLPPTPRIPHTLPQHSSSNTNVCKGVSERIRGECWRWLAHTHSGRAQPSTHRDSLSKPHSPWKTRIQTSFPTKTQRSAANEKTRPQGCSCVFAGRCHHVSQVHPVAPEEATMREHHDVCTWGVERLTPACAARVLAGSSSGCFWFFVFWPSGALSLSLWGWGPLGCWDADQQPCHPSRVRRP